MNPTTSIVFIGHGSRNPEANQEFEKLVSVYQERRKDLKASIGYIELAKPFMGDALHEAASRSNHVIVMPLLLFRAGHAKNDVPMVVREVRKKFPHVRIDAADVMGVHPKLAELSEIRLQETLNLSEEEKKKTAIIYLGRGSSDPDANGDLYKQTRIFAEGRKFNQIQPCFIGIASPGLEETLNQVARSRPDRIVVIPHLLFAGTLMEKVTGILDKFIQEYPWIKMQISKPFGIHPLLLDVIDERVRQSISGELSLPCDSCKFRTPLPSQEAHVGGLKALLWSIRHSFTHNQAMPHQHAHKPLTKHVLVCGNVDCAEKGSIRTIAALRDGIKNRGLNKEIAVTRTSCMGHCGEGPTMAVYPDGIWYRGVQADDAEEIIEQHLVKDKLVARLVDNIMG